MTFYSFNLYPNSMNIHSTVAVVKSVALTGFEGSIIDVETDMKAGLPSLQIVGMGNKAIDEARQRVRSAITNSHLEFPTRKLTVNLAPAELPKDGTHLDLPIALSVLVASGQIKKSEVEAAIFVGELALDGHIRPIRGSVVIAEAAKRARYSTLFIPLENVQQARLVSGVEVIGVSRLDELFKHLRGVSKITATPILPLTVVQGSHLVYPSLDEVIGHEQAKRALAIAATGRHNILFTGPPGTGKTLLARTLAGLLPPLVENEIIDVTKLYSLSGGIAGEIITSPPFRAPHHSVTLSALIGGGLRPKPGDISLAHKGVLLLDELPEYPRNILEALRQPLEDRVITLSRLYGCITYPADILLVATMNPCPCGFMGDPQTPCGCSSMQINAYTKRVSGPLLDRIDLRLTLSKESSEHFFDTKVLKNNQQFKVLKQIKIARKAQAVRYKCSNFYNAHASLNDAKQLFNSTPAARQFLKNATQKLGLSNRGSLRILRVARTIADLEQAVQLEQRHVAEALQFRGT